MKCGIMDQMISASGLAGHALLIDCRSLETEPAPLPPGTAVAILDTATRRGLVDSAYNERRAQCEAAARFFGVRALRDVTLAQFEARADELDALTRQRANTSLLRTRARCKPPLRCAGRCRRDGRLMDQSHVSLRDDFEVSSAALNSMVDCAHENPTCFGARMTGGGFGGCAVALIRAEAAQSFAASVSERYHSVTGLKPSVYISQPAQGAEIVEI